MSDNLTRSIARAKLQMLKQQLEGDDWDAFYEIAMDSLSDDQLAILLSHVTDKATACHSAASFSTIDELYALWIVKRNTLPDWIYGHADACVRKANSLRDNAAREVQVKRLSYMLNIQWDNPPFQVDIVSFRQFISATHYGMHHVIDQIEEELIAAKHSLKRWMKPILLHGPFGVGKTSLIQTIADYLRLPYVYTALGGKSDPATFAGGSQIYANAEAGLFLSLLAIAKTTRAVIHIDEIDKVFEAPNGQYQSKLANVFLEPFDTGWLTDELLGFPVDIRDALIFVTANSLSDIPAALLDRMQIISLQGYDSTEKTHIAKEYIWPKIQAQFNVALPTLTSEAIQIIIANRRAEPGIRGIEKDLEKLAKYALACFEKGKQLPEIDPSVVYSQISVSLSKPTKCESVMGQIHSLGVTPDYVGVVTTIQCIAEMGQQDVTIIGYPMKDFEQVCRLAAYLARKNTPSCENYDIYYHLGTDPIRMGGSSAGLALYAVAISALLKMPIGGDIAVTGAIDLFGTVLPVDGISQKIAAAVQAGCHHVIIPYDNLQECKITDHINVIGIQHVSEVIPALQKVSITTPTN